MSVFSTCKKHEQDGEYTATRQQARDTNAHTDTSQHDPMKRTNHRAIRSDTFSCCMHVAATSGLTTNVNVHTCGRREGASMPDKPRTEILEFLLSLFSVLLASSYSSSQSHTPTHSTVEQEVRSCRERRRLALMVTR